MQIEKLKKKADRLHRIHGEVNFSSIYGGGCIKNPRAMFVFMNPTGRNVAAQKNWRGIRAPWLGTKNAWKLFYATKFISEKTYLEIRKLKPSEWTPHFAETLYREIAKNGGYITNLAKCTQRDARPLKNDVFKNYLSLIKEEISLINPKAIITFGNQVSSILLEKPISVGLYKKTESEKIELEKKKFSIFPVYYPVGQGMRNLPLAIKRINLILK
jgi:DNA polymerase